MPVEPKKNRTGLIIAVIVIVLCCCCLVGAGLGYWLWQNGDRLIGTGALLNSLAAL
jgi:DNA-binding transcriptional regulator of glucitol operon